MIEFDSVTKAYGGDLILDTLSFKVNKGEKCGLVGRNGAGKTTLLRMMTREEVPDKGVVNLPKSYSLGYLSQHLHFTKDTLLEEAAEALREKEELHKAEKILFGLGFREKDLDLHPNKFSGGYQLRIHLAKVLIQEPDCLLLDEPTNYLDIVSIRWFTRFLRSWRGEAVLISHDRDFMDSVTTHTIGIHRKKIHKLAGGTERFYTHLLHEEQIQEKTRMNLGKKRAHIETFITKLGAKASKASQAQSRVKALARMPVLEELAAIYHLNFSFPFAPFPGRGLLNAEQVSFTYEGMEQCLIPQFTLSIEKGDRIAIIGKNGRGKSTLLKLLSQDITPQSGTIKAAANSKIGFFGQTNIDRLRPEMTIEEEIASATKNLSISEIRKICGVMMFSGDRAKKKIGVLSGGEKSRVLLGKILVSPCNLLLLDEPTNHLDMESIEALMRALDLFEGAVVIVTHSEMILKRIPTRFVICHQGNQHLFEGSYEDFLSKEGWESGDVQPVLKKAAPMRAKNPKQQQRELERLEAQIKKIEEEMNEEISRLVIASQNNDGPTIANLTKSIDEKKAKTEALFLDLGKLLEG